MKPAAAAVLLSCCWPWHRGKQRDSSSYVDRTEGKKLKAGEKNHMLAIPPARLINVRKTALVLVFMSFLYLVLEFAKDAVLKSFPARI
jgi:hypothetical protein